MTPADPAPAGTAPGPLLGSGDEADVYVLDEGRVLRRYRDGGDVAAEAAVMVYVGGLGYPVPRVYEARGADLVMERLSGDTMLAAFRAGTMGLDEGAALLADLHHRLHALPPRPGARPGDRVLHMDLHPANVMLTPGGPVVIDWRNGTDGPAALDLARSAVIMAHVAVTPGTELAGVARALLTAFLARVGAVPADVLDAAIAHRARDSTVSADARDRLPAAAALIRVAC